MKYCSIVQRPSRARLANISKCRLPANGTHTLSWRIYRAATARERYLRKTSLYFQNSYLAKYLEYFARVKRARECTVGEAFKMLSRYYGTLSKQF